MDTFSWALKLTVISFIILIFIIMFADIEITNAERAAAVEKANTLTRQIIDQNNAIKKIHEEELQKQKEMQHALKEAQKERDSYNLKAKKILSERVSSDCEEAIKWGAENGKIIYQCWIYPC